jgi:hypothetical protein
LRNNKAHKNDSNVAVNSAKSSFNGPEELASLRTTVDTQNLPAPPDKKGAGGAGKFCVSTVVRRLASSSGPLKLDFAELTFRAIGFLLQT